MGVQRVGPRGDASGAGRSARRALGREIQTPFPVLFRKQQLLTLK